MKKILAALLFMSIFPAIAFADSPRLQVTAHSVSISWTASITPGVSYLALRGPCGGPWTVSMPVSGLTASDTNVLPGLTYGYVIQAVLSGVNSDNSAESCATIPGALPLPTATLTASPASIIKGQSSTITLATTNATTCTGALPTCSGNGTVTPSVTTTYNETATGAGGSVTASATVTVNPASNFTEYVTPTSLNFSASGSQTIVVNDTSPSSQPFTIASDSPWLTTNIVSGKTRQNVIVSVNTGSLAAGTYHGTISLLMPQSSNSPLLVPVTFVVSGPPPPPVLSITGSWNKLLQHIGATVNGTPAHTSVIITAFIVVDPKNCVSVTVARP